ncbi:hypothetical protein BH09PSE1_BH09PSE1_02250 [soil metagenome]
MDVNFFLIQRTAFIRRFHDEAVAIFEDTQRRIDQAQAPFDSPPSGEDGEPAFLTEWIDAGTGREVVAQACVSLLSDSLKLYFNTLQKDVIGFAFDKREKALAKKGFVGAYRVALGEILQTDWSECAVRFDVIEQVVLARNLSQHGGRLTSLRIAHDLHSLKGRTSPIFANPAEWTAWQDSGGDEATFLMPSVVITRAALFEAIDEVERLGNWIDGHLDRVDAWRGRQVPDNPESEAFGLLSAAGSALELCGEALALFDERRPEVLEQGDAKGLMFDGRRLERSVGGPLTARGLLGAQAFLSNLVVVENCVARLSGLAGLPPHLKANALDAVKAIRKVVDREVRNTAEHIDDRVASRADKGLISSSIFETDLLCSTRLDGSVGAVSITQATLDAVSQALNGIIWSPETLASLPLRRSE